MTDNENNRYPTESLKPSDVYFASLKGWGVALKLAFLPFLIAVILDIGLALMSHSINSITGVYGLKVLSVLISFYCVLLAFYFIHANWRGEQVSCQAKIGVYSRRFFPALVSFVIIFAVALVLMAVGFVLMRMLQPYAHLLGQVAAPILVSVVGLLAIIWVVACFYWPFYVIRDAERFLFAIKKSYAIAGLTKTAMVYMPAVAFVLIFLLTNQRMPWMNHFHSVWIDIAIGFVIKWVLGSWALTFMCLMMKQSDFMLDRFDAETEERARKKSEKKANKKK